MSTEVITRVRETRRRAAQIVKRLPEAKGPAGVWATAQISMQGLLAEQTAAVAEALEGIRDILLLMRADTPTS